VPIYSQKRLDAVLNPDPFPYEVLAFAVRALGVLLGGRGDAKHAADMVIALMARRQNSEQALRVEPIGLGPPRSSVDEDAGRLDDIIDDVGLSDRFELVSPRAVRLSLMPRISRATRRERRRGSL
jgi:hypothetical protein